MVAAPPLDRISVGEAGVRYLRNVERAVTGGSLAETTAAYYRRDVEEFVELAGADTILDDLTAEDLDDVMLAFAAKPDGRYATPVPEKTRGKGSQARFRTSVAQLFNEALASGWIEANPVPRMRVKPTAPSLKTSVRRRALPQSSADALIERAAPPPESASKRGDQKLNLRDTFLLRLMVESGPRVSEISRANRSDFDRRDDGTTWLCLHGKGDKVRDVPLSPETWQAYQAYEREERPQAAPRVQRKDGVEVQTVSAADAEQALVLTWRGRRMMPRDIQLMVHRAVAGLPADVRREVTPHGLRHTAATLLLSSGAADIATVRELLGHESIATTGIYLDRIDYELSRAVAAHPVTSRAGRPDAGQARTDEPASRG